jgi:hypothetical protein
MREECLEEVGKVLGRQIAPNQGESIEARVKNAMRVLARQDPEGWRAKSYFDRLHEAAKMAAQMMKEEFARKKLQIERTVAAHDRIENFLASQPDRKPQDKLRAVSRLLDFDTRRGGFQSVHSWANAVKAEAFSNLRPAWDAIPGFWGLFESKQGVADLWREIHGEDSGNAIAKRGADAWRAVTEEMRQRFNDGGGHIGKLEDWSKPQHHSQERVAKAGIDKWITDTLPLLDRQKYVNYDGSRMSTDQMHEFLGHAYDSIITDGQNKLEGKVQHGTGVIADRNSQHRQIFFKDSDAAAQYNASYGEKQLHTVLTDHISRLARDIALVERLGPNAEATFKHFNDRALLDSLRSDPDKADKIRASHNFNQALFDDVSGKQQVVNQRIADAGQTFRNWMTATRLGKVVITALGDEAGMWSTSIANHVPYSSALLRELASIPKGKAREFAEHAALGTDAMVGNLNRFAMENFGSSFSGKVASSVMRISGAERMWAARRQGLGAVLMSSIGKLSRSLDSVDKLSAADHGVIAGKGISERTWQVWRRAQPEDWGKGARTVLTPKSVWAIPDAQLKDLGDPRTLKREASTGLLAHVLEEAGMGAMDSGPRQRIAVNLGTQRGSVGGEIWRSMNLFRGFAFSMMMKHWARAAEMNGVGRIKYMAPLFVYGTLIAAAGNQIRNLLSGEDPDKMSGEDAWKFWGKAILRGGGLGFFGDFLQNETSSKDTSLAAALGGPGLASLEDIWNVTGAAAIKAARGEKTDEGAKLIRLARSNVPFANMWYTQAAADHLVWNHLQEAASPGYLERLQAKMEATYGKHYYWAPNENLPSAAPDLSRAVQ